MIKSDAKADIASRWSSPEGEISYQEDSENEEQLAHCKLPLYVLVQICHLFGFFLHGKSRKQMYSTRMALEQSEVQRTTGGLLVKGYV